MRNSSKESLYSAQCSEPGLDACSESMKIADALNFVIRKFHAKVIFKAGEQFERLQAVDAELLIEIIARAKLGARKFEMSGGEVQDFVRGLFDCVHACMHFTGKKCPLANDSVSPASTGALHRPR